MSGRPVIEGATATPGFHGKLPGKGDFLTRRLPRSFVGPWDGWLQGVIAASKAALGPQWLEIYLNSPIWRFALSTGVCDDSGWAGVLMPSVDRVGRYFPLTVAVTTGRANPFTAVSGASGWFDAAETLALSALDEEQFDLESFSEAVAALGASVFADDGADIEVMDGAAVALEDLEHAADVIPDVLAGFATARFQAYSVWWSGGSDRVAPSLCVRGGLPDEQFFTAMLAGEWEEEPATSSDELTGDLL